MRSAKGRIDNYMSRLLLVFVVLAVTVSTAFAAEKERKPREDDRSKDAAIEHRIGTDRDTNNQKPAEPRKKPEVRDDKPFNPWGDDRYDKKPSTKPDNPNIKPGIVIRDNDRRDAREKWEIFSADRNRNDRIKPPNAQVTHKVQTNKKDGVRYNRAPTYRYWGFNAFDTNYLPSLYFYYGNYPYLNRSRIRVLPYVTVNNYVETTYFYGGEYYLSSSRRDVDNALSDIKYAWIQQRDDLIDRHLMRGQMIAVLLDGRYDYSVDPVDYLDMTSDAIYDIQTISFNWESVKRRANGEYTAFGKHIYRDYDGINRTVYVSYTLKKIGREYIIVEVGSSNRYLG